MDVTVLASVGRVDGELNMEPRRQATAAARMNRNLIRELLHAVEEDPEVDLLSLLPDDYREKLAVRNQLATQSAPLSVAAALNQKTISHFRLMLKGNPELDLRTTFPKDYASGMGVAQRSAAPKSSIAIPADTVLTLLEDVDTATVVHPLSRTVMELVSRHSNLEGSSKKIVERPSPPFDKRVRYSDPLPGDAPAWLVSSVKGLLKDSQTLWACPVRGLVLKCSEAVVAKVLKCTVDYTEYTTMQYLAEHAPDVPAPRAHGLLRFDGFTVVFMSYIPAMTLTQAWPMLTNPMKSSVQQQLDRIFQRLRKLKQKDGLPLGGLGGEGVKVFHFGDYRNGQPVNTIAEFEDFAFSIQHQGSDLYVDLLRRLLPKPSQETVFTHGDVRPDNIMVRMDEDDECRVTGLIDWGDSGFYPEYYECTRLTGTMNPMIKTDWYEYLPPCISPKTFPVEWLVDRLWHIHVKYAH
ncbi:MAG: hypothetical protein M1817_001162 [Caeruleum heppii]|nr:MAG: hypothetical protein M1817_001162 [Caeruleum heppii]